MWIAIINKAFNKYIKISVCVCIYIYIHVPGLANPHQNDKAPPSRGVLGPYYHGKPSLPPCEAIRPVGLECRHSVRLLPDVGVKRHEGVGVR